ncbi:RE1, partial [Symbiodinium microadriaticum]
SLRDLSERVMGSVKGSDLTGIFEGIPVAPSAIRASHLGVGFNESNSFQEAADPGWEKGVLRGRPDAHDDLVDPWQGLDITGLGVGPGRDPFVPGERTFWNLPTLEDPSQPSPATRASDWLVQIRPMLYDLSDMSQSWWQRVEFESQGWYQRWCRASALERGLIVPQMSPELSHMRFRRLESRAYGMLQTAVPAVIRDELLASRSLNCMSLLFQVLKVYAPGGLQERTQILGELTNLGIARNASEAVQALRSWNRTYARARTMGVSVPDPALVLRGLDALTEGLLRKAVHAQVSFRVSTARNHLRLDHNPTMGSVMEFLKILQSEWEQVSVSGQEETPKPPKAARLEAEAKGEPKGEKGGDEKGKNLKGKGRDEKGSYGGGKASDAQPSAGGVLDTELENGCPTVTESLCLQLIGELEQCRAQKIRRALNLRALKLGSPCEESDQPCAWGSESDVLRALREICPEESEGILARAVPNQCGEYPVGPRHFRQKHRHANALTLNLDLIGPWTAGDDHALAGPARHILVATLGVPILKDGKPLPLEKETEGEEKEREEGNEDDGGGVGPIGPEDGDDQLVLEDPESKEESEEGELSPEEYAALYERQEAKWREIAKELQEPVQVHEVLFAEPLQSKRSEEVLRGIQRIYSKITVMNLSVRRFHVAPVVYAGVRDPIKFVGEIDEEEPPLPPPRLSFPLPPIVSLPATPVHSLRCEHVMLRQLLIEQHKCYDEEVTVAASEGRTASNLHLHDLCTWIDECEQGLVWQDTCDLLKSGAVGEAESAVLGARLAHLGVSWDSASEVGVSLYRDEGSGEGLSPEEEVMPSAWEAQPAQPLQTVSVSHQEVLKRVEDWKGAIVDELSNVFDVHEAMRRCSESELQAWKEAGEQVEILPAKAGFAAPGEYWEITGALYGLQTSPADWAIYRDETLPTLDVWCGDQKTHLRRSKHDPNLWLLYCPKTSRLIAALTIYVDDLLLSGTPEASQAVWEAIKAKWKISEPEYADQGVVTFCGFEIRQQPDGIHVGQAKYVQSLLDKYSEVTGTSSCPYARESEVIDAKPQESIEKLRRAQAVAGELLWLATRTRPDLAFGVSRIGQLITKDVDQALRRGEEMIKYLRTTKQQELIYGEPGLGHGAADQLPVARDFNLIEVFADASFCPGTDRSQSGIVLMWGNCPIGWMSMRQPCASLSTAEAELQSSLDGMTLAEGIYGLLEELAEAPQSAFLYNDNVGCGWLRGSVYQGIYRVLRDPSIELKGEGPRMLNASQPGREMSGLPQGVLHDDGASGADLAEGSPAGELDGLNEGTGRGELEHDLQEDANAEIVNVRRSRETERERLEIHPGWTLRLPPRFSWDPKPEWGSWESLFHQSIPKAVKRDFYYHDRVRSVLVRFHAQERRQLFVPSPGGLPESVSWANLTGRRRTFHRGVTTNPAGILEDEWNVPHPKPARQISTEKWIGRTEFELQDS